MRQVGNTLINPVVIVWTIALYRCFSDIRFPAALYVGVIGIALIIQLLKRVGRTLMKAITTLAIIGVLVALIVDPAARARLVTFLDEVLVFDGPHMIVLATVFTFWHGVVHRPRATPQRPA